eukprot:14474174-Alexandrium_andersonii.AAC.1
MLENALASGGGRCFQAYNTCPPLVARATILPHGAQGAIEIEFARSDSAEEQLEAGVSPTQDLVVSLSSASAVHTPPEQT